MPFGGYGMRGGYGGMGGKEMCAWSGEERNECEYLHLTSLIQFF